MVRARSMQQADPERLVELVDDEVDHRRADQLLKREERMIQSSFLTIQGKLEAGATIYGEADAESAPTIIEALDAVTDRPVHPDEGPSRAQQHFEALLRICEATLGGGVATTRPRARVLVCHAHHLVPGVGNKAEDGCLECRTCHRITYGYGWKGTLHPDGTIEFKRGNKGFKSLPP